MRWPYTWTPFALRTPDHQGAQRSNKWFSSSRLPPSHWLCHLLQHSTWWRREALEKNWTQVAHCHNCTRSKMIGACSSITSEERRPFKMAKTGHCRGISRICVNSVCWMYLSPHDMLTVKPPYLLFYPVKSSSDCVLSSVLALFWNIPWEEEWNHEHFKWFHRKW